VLRPRIIDSAAPFGGAARGRRHDQKENNVTTVVHKPDRQLGNAEELLLGFLDYYRSVIIRKIEGLPMRSYAPAACHRAGLP
jgi:hypothetical protein